MGMKFKFWRFMVTRFFKRWLPSVGATLLVVVSTGCLTTNDSALRVLPEVASLGPENDPHGSDPHRGVPLDEVRDDFRAARTQDSTLELAFYRTPFEPYEFDRSVESREKPTRAGVESDFEKSLIARLQSEIEPSSWSQPGRRSFVEGDWLVVFQTSGVQKQIADWAQAVRAEADAGRLVTVEVRTLLIPNEASVEERIGRPSSGDQYVVDPTVLRELSKIEGAHHVAAPQLTAFEGQRATVVIMNQVAYVQDVEVYTVERQTIADPVIDVLNEGLSCDIVAKFEDDDSITVALDLSLTDVEGWGTSEVTPPRTDTTISIQLPEISNVRSQQRLRVAKGESLLVRAVPSPAKDGRDLWICVTASEASQ